MDNISDILLDWYARHGPRSALETHPRSLPHMALRGDPPADPRRAGHGLLPALHGALSRRRVAGRRSGGRGAQVVAGTRLLQPCVQPARCGAAGRGAVRRRASPVLRRGPLAAGRRRLYPPRPSARPLTTLPAPCSTAMFFRVLARLFDIDLPIDSTAGKRTFAELAQTQLDMRLSGALQSGRHGVSGRCNALRRSPDAPTVRLRRAVWLWPQERLRSVPSSRRKPRCATVGSTTCTSHAATGPRCGGAGKATSGRDLYEFPMIETDACGGFLGTNAIRKSSEPPAGWRSEWRLLRSVAMPKHQLSHQTAACRRSTASRCLFPCGFPPAVPTATLGDYAVPRLDRPLSDAGRFSRR